MTVATHAVRSDEEMAEAARVYITAFGDNPTAEKIARTTTARRTYPGYHPALLRVRTDGDRVVSTLRIVERVLRVGIGEWRLAGVADVATDPGAGRQGHASAVVHDALDFMRQEKFDVTLLHGISDFYDRFGYAVTWPDCYLSIPLKVARALTGEGSIRPVTLDDISALNALYDAAWESRMGALARGEDYWRWVLAQERTLWAVTDVKGAVRGYVGLSSWRPNMIVELAAADAQAASALVRHAAQQMDEEEAPAIRIATVRDDPVVGWLRRLCPTTWTETTTPAGGWMGRFIDLRSAMTKLSEELTARFMRSMLREWRGRVNLETDLGAVALGCRLGHVTVMDAPPGGKMTCRIPQDRLLQLIMGYRTCADIARDPDVTIPQDARPLLEVLFPPTAAGIAGLDWF